MLTIFSYFLLDTGNEIKRESSALFARGAAADIGLGDTSFSGSLSLDNALAGVGGAVASTVALHPLDLVKIRLQVDAASQNDAIVGRAIRATRHVLRHDGVGGLYRGLVPNLAGNCASWGLYFAWYTWIKDQMAGTSTLSAAQHLAAGAMAGALTQCMANPLWVVKTRMCTTSRADPCAYRGLMHGLTQIATKEGVRGLYKGLAPGLLGVPHGGLQFMAYEEMKKWRLRVRGPNQSVDKFSSFEYAAMSTTSKIGRSEGLGGFYKGFGPGLVRVLPGNIITFLVYENIASYFRKHAH
ncbi:mitochondrial carrier [Linderina pennispora]|uniref:Mitochondrial carrier n=1 Tax=Linderina pennispora TaxID=61395 RepID=A0A1Y1WI44_9FUNG|nr:mitochondrial carrier [Linderina pennispora]ORX72896.1 mitochondrial carrier [Linderina pennispora]